MKKTIILCLLLAIPLYSGGFKNLTDNSKVAKTGDTMTGNLDITSSGFSVGGSTLVVKNGKVGIGKTPTVELDINGAIYSSNYISTGNSLRAPFWLGENFYFRNSADTLRWMTLETGGDVGISTSTPTHKLDINGGAIVRSSITATSDIYVSTNTAGLIQYDTDSGTQAWRFRVDAAGNITVQKAN